MGRDPVFEPHGIISRTGLPRLWGYDPERLWSRVLRFTLSPLTVWLAPSYGYGLERVPVTGGGVIAANHLSAIDPTLIGAYCPRAVFYMAKAELLAMPVIGEALMHTGAFPVRRGEGDRDALRWARKLVREGHMLGMFPEGTRQRFGYPGAMHPGTFIIAMSERVPVVPCGLYSFGWTQKNHMPCCVVWGEPLDFSDLPRSGSGYRKAADIVGAEVLRLWRLAAEAIATGYPKELPDGSRRSERVRGSLRKRALESRKAAI